MAFSNLHIQQRRVLSSPTNDIFKFARKVQTLGANVRFYVLLEVYWEKASSLVVEQSCDCFPPPLPLTWQASPATISTRGKRLYFFFITNILEFQKVSAALSAVQCRSPFLKNVYTVKRTYFDTFFQKTVFFFKICFRYTPWKFLEVCLNSESMWRWIPVYNFKTTFALKKLFLAGVEPYRHFAKLWHIEGFTYVKAFI